MNNFRKQSYDVVIIGGGIVGLTLACLLPSTLTIAIVEQQSLGKISLSEKYDLRVSAINHASQKIFAQMGIWPNIEKIRVSPFRAMQVWDAVGKGEINFNSLEIGESTLGHIIENRVMQTALLDQLQQKEIEIIAPAVIDKLTVEDSLVTITLQNGQQLTTRLLVGADGANSWVREAVGIELKKWPYYQQALVTTVQTELPHQEVARQRFLSNGILAFLPLLPANYCSIVWSTSLEESERLMRLTAMDFSKNLSAAFANVLGEIKETDRLQSFPLHMRHAKNYVKHRIALIGDAAHTIHPLAGQGMNLGLADAACLARVVSNTIVKDRDIGHVDTLRRYERERKGNNLLMIGVMESFKRLFGAQSDTLIFLRNAGLNLTNKSRLLKNFFMREAVGR